ncbi:Ion channel CASTOR [Linum grandiflorum]
MLRARQRKEIVIGYRLCNAERAVVNPTGKSERRRWSVKDVFVVIAEKEYKHTIQTRKNSTLPRYDLTYASSRLFFSLRMRGLSRMRAAYF